MTAETCTSPGTWWGFRRAMFMILFLMLALNLRIASADAEPIERILWRRMPIPITLTAGTERRVDFPGPVELGVPAAIASALRIQTVGSSVHLLAHRSFSSTRVLARRIDGEEIYLLDLAAAAPDSSIEATPATIPLAIVVEEEPSATCACDGAADAPGFGYVALTRYAAQQLYAPARLLKEVPGIVRVPVASAPVELFGNAAIEATPLIAWRAGTRYLTAVRLANASTHLIILDPRNLRGAWLAATFQHHRLHPAGGDTARTVVYLISAEPFAATLK